MLGPNRTRANARIKLFVIVRDDESAGRGLASVALGPKVDSAGESPSAVTMNLQPERSHAAFITRNPVATALHPNAAFCLSSQGQHTTQRQELGLDSNHIDVIFVHGQIQGQRVVRTDRNNARLWLSRTLAAQLG